MIVKTITDSESGRKWEIIKDAENLYSVKYYEYFNACGWRFVCADHGYSKACIEGEFETTIA